MIEQKVYKSCARWHQLASSSSQCHAVACAHKAAAAAAISAEIDSSRPVVTHASRPTARRLYIQSWAVEESDIVAPALFEGLPDDTLNHFIANTLRLYPSAVVVQHSSSCSRSVDSSPAQPSCFQWFSVAQTLMLRRIGLHAARAQV